ncbi:MAG TPA: hypothetical protein DCS28_01335 [Candidatus Moranbacteria bacterium]|nr:hypothetical protein [Candidatus Moranbacteria bacterium]HAT74669.1 hypothetical protein [Candidatus Moranbacteria bacterium]
MNILDYICCPVCKSNLEKKERGFFCFDCNKNYEIMDEIPILVDFKKIPDHSAGQINYFKKEKIIENPEFKLDEWQKGYVEKFTANFPDVKNKTILDCGAGSGYMSVELAKKGATVFACDLTLKGLKRLKKISVNSNLAIKTICCSAEELPFKNETFDYFISNAVLEHLPREKEAIAEINRVCKKDAGLMITVPLNYKFLNPLFISINWFHDKRIGHLRRYDEKKLINKFTGWNAQDVYYTGHTKKVLKTLINIVAEVFNELKIEKDDRKKEKLKLWASNVICFFRR